MTRIVKFSLVIVFLLTSAFLISATPASAQGGIPSSPILTPAGCTLTASFTSSDAIGSTTYTLELWDDFMMIDSSSVTVAPSTPVSLSVTVTSAIGTGVPGVGVYLRANGSLVYINDPYLGLDGPCSAAQSGCKIAEGGYQGLLTQDVQLFWAASADKPVQPTTVIKAGMVVTINDAATPGWYKITWACATYYIKIDGVVGNPAKVTKPYLPGVPASNK